MMETAIETPPRVKIEVVDDAEEGCGADREQIPWTAKVKTEEPEFIGADHAIPQILPSSTGRPPKPAFLCVDPDDLSAEEDENGDEDEDEDEDDPAPVATMYVETIKREPEWEDVMGRNMIHETVVVKDERPATDNELHDCPRCGATFRGLLYLERHIRTHASHKCGECGKHFRSRLNLMRHINTHSKVPKVHICSLCNETFRTRPEMRRHMHRVHNLDMTGKLNTCCKECGQEFDATADLKTHMKDVHGAEVFSCHECGDLFAQRINLAGHMRKHSKVEKKPRKSPQKTASSKNTNVDPRENVSVVMGTVGSELTREAGIQGCRDAGVASENGIPLDPKTGSEVGNIGAKGEVKVKRKPKVPKQNGVTGKPPGEVKPKHPIKCDECDMEFTWKYLYRDHLAKVHGRKRYECTECGKSFGNRKSYYVHHQMHTGEMPYTCEFCGKRFHWGLSLKYHLRTHSEERKPFKCDICKKEFTLEKLLNDHLRVHAMDNTFQCDICNHVFTQKANMLLHRRIHAGEKPFKCDLCGKAVTTKTYLKAHMRLHIGDNDCKCPICGKQLTTRAYMLKHMKIHEREEKGEKAPEQKSEAPETPLDEQRGTI